MIPNQQRSGAGRAARATIRGAGRPPLRSRSPTVAGMRRAGRRRRDAWSAAQRCDSRFTVPLRRNRSQVIITSMRNDHWCISMGNDDDHICAQWPFV